ncbi:hypothetical protein HY639_05475 [Candidatus Woesearchaeota archaeon]|nr:hypothetical protein [Candidatus Woesearchaeota archaeon]
MKGVYLLLAIVIVGCTEETMPTNQRVIDVTGTERIELAQTEKIILARNGQQISLRFLGDVDGKQMFEINRIPVTFEIGVQKIINRLIAFTLEAVENKEEKGVLVEFFLGQAQGTLEQGGTKLVQIAGRDYLVTALQENRFIVNGEETASIHVGGTYVLRSTHTIGVRDIIETDKTVRQERAIITVSPS